MIYVFNSLYRMQKNGKTVVNPAPVDLDTPNAPWLAEQAVTLAPQLASVGVTVWLWPPLTMSQGRSTPNADGYGKNFDYNVGQWSPTRWGTAKKVLAANKALHAAGLYVMEDAVIHQYDGGNKQVYIELGSNGKPDPTLFPKGPNQFAPTAPVDDVFDSNGNNWDGDLACYQKSTPKDYMLNGMLQSLLWRKRALSLDGLREDEAKGEALTTTHAIAMVVGGKIVAEAYTAGPELVQFDDEAGVPSLDFGFHFGAKAACEGGSFWNWRNSGAWLTRPNSSWLFPDTGDTDLNNNTNIRFNKIWTYVVGMNVAASAFLIYSADYLPERYNLKHLIDNILWFATTFAFGPTEFPYTDDTFIVIRRNGDGGKYGWSGGCLIALNSDPINTRGEWVYFGTPNVQLHNYAPTFGPDTWTNKDGWAYIQAGPNEYGAAKSYSLWAVANVENKIAPSPVPHNPTVALNDFSSIPRVTV